MNRFNSLIDECYEALDKDGSMRKQIIAEGKHAVVEHTTLAERDAVIQVQSKVSKSKNIPIKK